MRDAAALVIAGAQVTSFVSYEADSNVLVPADAFACRIARIDPSVKPGVRFQIVINGFLEMTGVIDKVSCSYKRGSGEMSVEGRDLMGLLVDSSIEQWKTIQETNLKDLAKRLLKNVPFLDAERVVYAAEKAATGVKAKKSGRSPQSGFDAVISSSQLEPGATIFEELSDYGQRHGLIMWMEPDGTLVFGELQGRGAPVEFSFQTVKVGEKDNNNIISANLVDDVSKRYSQVTVIGQMQGNDGFGAGEQTVTKTEQNAGFPGNGARNFKKPLVLQTPVVNAKGASHQARWEIKKREAAGWRLELTVAGHSQNGHNFRANAACHVKDEVLGIDDDYLILGRKFTMSRTEGPRTQLTIGKLTEGYQTA